MTGPERALDFAVSQMRDGRPVTADGLVAEYRITPTSADRIIRHAEDATAGPPVKPGARTGKPWVSETKARGAARQDSFVRGLGTREQK